MILPLLYVAEAVVVMAVVLAWPRRARHYRWRNRRFLKRLRSREGVGSGQVDRSTPQGWSATAGVEQGGPPSAAAPPASSASVGRGVSPAAAPGRAPLVRIGGAL